MEYPKGFKELVDLMKKNKAPVLQGKDLWDKFCRAVLIGKGRSEPEISFIMNMLKQKLDYDYVLKTPGEDWQEDVGNFLKDRLTRIKDEEVKEMLEDIVKGLFYTTATIKSGARFFRDKKIFENLDSLTSTKEKTRQLIEEMVSSQDLTGIRYAKAILWLQYTGRAVDFAPPTRHLKDFVNKDIGPYYQFYEDDKYFMDKADEILKDFKNVSMMDIYRAIYFYRSLKLMLGPRSKLTPKVLLDFMKKNKISIEKLNDILSSTEEREKIGEKLFRFLKEK